MNWKSEHKRIYEQRIVDDALTRLRDSIRGEDLPFSQDELQTLLKRHRAAVHGTDKNLERLGKYQTHLTTAYGPEIVGKVSSLLTSIMNDIGYEEK
jgi:hypothetical protein